LLTIIIDLRKFTTPQIPNTALAGCHSYIAQVFTTQASSDCRPTSYKLPDDARTLTAWLRLKRDRGGVTAAPHGSGKDKDPAVDAVRRSACHVVVAQRAQQHRLLRPISG
jgi:hypothetical protein